MSMASRMTWTRAKRDVEREWRGELIDGRRAEEATYQQLLVWGSLREI